MDSCFNTSPNALQFVAPRFHRRAFIGCSWILANRAAYRRHRNWRSIHASRNRRAKERNRPAWQVGPGAAGRCRIPSRNYRNENGRAWRVRFPPRRKNGIRDWRRRSCVRGRFRPASRARDKASRDQAPILRVPARSGCDSAPPASNATTAGRGCAPASRVRHNALSAKQRIRDRGREATRESLPVGNRPIRPQRRKQMQPGCTLKTVWPGRPGYLRLARGCAES